jgi:RNA polymerase sigma factor (sigma-70 family)
MTAATARDGDARRSFETAVEPLVPDLLAYFVRRTVPRDDAADCLSETMIVLWHKRKSLPEGMEECRAWAFGIAKRVLANQRRGTLRRHALADRVRREVQTSAAAPDHTVSDSMDSDILASLPPIESELVRLIVWDGFGVAEAGALLGLTPGAARTRFARAKQRLRSELMPILQDRSPSST